MSRGVDDPEAGACSLLAGIPDGLGHSDEPELELVHEVIERHLRAAGSPDVHVQQRVQEVVDLGVRHEWHAGAKRAQYVTKPADVVLSHGCHGLLHVHLGNQSVYFWVCHVGPLGRCYALETTAPEAVCQ